MSIASFASRFSVFIVAATFVLAGCSGGADTQQNVDPTPSPATTDTTAPTTPQGLIATAVSATRIDLAWSASTDTGGAGLAGYRIFRSGSTTALASPTGTAFSDTSVAANTTYSYVVFAYDVAGNQSSASTVVTATTPAPPPPVDTTAPTTPQNLTATATSTSTIALSWTASTDTGDSLLSGYRIYRNGSTAVLATVTTTTYTDTSVTANTTYSYVVRAIDNAGNQSNASNTANATTPSLPPPPDTTAPTTPQNLNATATSTTSVALNWTASTDAGGAGLSGYRIYRNGSTTALATVTTTTYTDTSVVPSTGYTYVVRAFDGATNQSAASNSVSVTTPATPPPPDLTAPSIPQNLSATATSSTTIALSWTASTDTGGSGLAGYRIYRNGAATALTTVTTNAYSDTTVTLSTAYSYVVRAIDNAGNQSAASNAANATTPGDTTAPSVPQNLTASALSQTSIALNWNAATDSGGSGLSGYRIYRNGSTTALATVTTTAYTDPSVEANTAYTYVVRAFDGAGNESAASSTARATTPGDTTPPSVPQSLSATPNGPTRIDLTWSDATDTGGSGLRGYRIYRNGSTTALASVTTTGYADLSLAPNTTYSYVVRAYDFAGNESTASNSASATTPIAPDTTSPTVPQNLSATPINSTRIDLSWSAATDSGGSGLSGYRIYRNGATTALATVTTTSYTDASVAASTAYTYVVRAFDGANNQSSQSNSAAATTPAAPSPGTPGLDVRPSNTSCVAWPRASSQLQTPRVFTSLSFSQPLAMLQAPNVNTHWYVVQKTGEVKRFSIGDPTSAPTFIDIRSRVYADSEGGLLGMAFHPNYPNDRRVFLSYTTADPGSLYSRISSFTVSADGTTADPNSENILLTLSQPAGNHNGGHIAFGPGGFLYIGFGDGGGGGDEFGNGQRMSTLHSKLLRIDVNVSAATKYVVPPSNPFYNAANPGDKCPANGTRASGTCPETYAYGLRNPWRWNFDRANGELWLADVGQNVYEEVNRVTSGGNYGWSCREGAHSFGGPACVGTSPIDPVVEYDHTLGQSITGGYVYRGTQTTPLVGRYIFGDFQSGTIWAWIEENATNRQPTPLVDTDLLISSFAQANDGELYVVNYSGTLHRLVFGSSDPGSTAPTLLSQTGCVADGNATQAASGLIPYDVNAPFWSDGATKHRWVGLPNNQNIVVGSNGDWDFPHGTVLMKQFSNATRLIETRLFMRHPDGTWGGFSYEWNAQQTDATLVRGGATRTIDGQPWIFPSEAQCTQCHTRTAGNSLGLETSQLNGDFTYPQTNRTANQLTTLNAIGVFASPIPDVAAAPRMPSPADAAAPLANRARAYLHTNCAQCHQTGGPTPSSMDLRYPTALSATSTCNAVPQLGDVGLGSAARLIVPGNAATSVLVSRVNRRDLHGMPPVGSTRIDTAGVALLTEWVNVLTSCP